MVVYTDPRMADHAPGPEHPERPARLSAARAGVEGLAGVTFHTPEPTTRERLCAVHDPSYVDLVFFRRGRAVPFDPDTVTSAGSVDAALLAAGAVEGAVDAVIAGPDPRAFAIVRPPGHHAERARAMGFCLFNNVALGVWRARAAGLRRALVVDWDVHHGNGTQHLFEEDPDVLFFSTHQGDGFYPGTGTVAERGRGAGTGATINVPLAAGQGHDALVAAFEDILVPAADAFRPEIVFVSAGFDAHRDDPLAHLEATDETFGALARIVRGIADRHGSGRLVLALEGGYDLGALERSVRACVRALT
jgi:acetoin utilization deacetylase AcuC-like enzyme